MLLSHKAAQTRKDTGDEKYRSENDTVDKKFVDLLKQALQRPVRLLFTQPIIQAISLYQAYLYGLLYLV